jgi:pimeloyl-ACP methyl ester carboxylesterase
MIKAAALATAAAVLPLLAAIAGPAGASAGPVLTVQCKPVSYAVSAGVPTTMTGQECSRPAFAGKHTLLVTLPGATYSHDYWNFPVSQPANSFTWSATLAGYTVVNLDELGTPPRASYPPAGDITVSSNADALHAVLDDLTIAGWRHIDVLGHSFGAVIAGTENSTYHDTYVDALVLQGFLHTDYAPGIAAAQASLIPAQADPVLGKLGLPDGYLTIKPGARQAVFGSTTDETPAVAAEDEATKTTVTGQELAGQDPSMVPAVTRAIHVPVLAVVGEFDNLFCGPSACTSQAAVYAREKPDYTAPLTLAVLPGAGHSINLAANAPALTAAELAWLAQHS